MASRSQQRSLPGLDTNAASAEPEQAKKSAIKSAAKSSENGDSSAKKSSAAAGPAANEPCDDLPQPVDIKGWNVYVVDSHSLIFQVFRAIPEMSSPRGEQVAAVFGLVRDMLYLIEDKKPSALI